MTLPLIPGTFTLTGVLTIMMSPSERSFFQFAVIPTRYVQRPGGARSMYRCCGTLERWSMYRRQLSGAPFRRSRQATPSIALRSPFDEGSGATGRERRIV